LTEGVTGASGLERRQAREGQLAILVAAVAWSTAGLAQRGLDADPGTQVAGRAAFAAVALFLLVLATERRGTLRAFRTMGRSGPPWRASSRSRRGPSCSR
jgi:drug/metabolite transporter (DMT)-like permease